VKGATRIWVYLPTFLSDLIKEVVERGYYTSSSRFIESAVREKLKREFWFLYQEKLLERRAKGKLVEKRAKKRKEPSGEGDQKD